MPRLAPPPTAARAIGPERGRPTRPADPALPETRCLNCGAASPGAYCPDCGQAQRDFHRPLHTFASDLFESLTGWDHKIPATFGLLLARPGALTREFLAGRRKHYLSPFQLYLFASALLFLALRMPLPSGQNFVRVTHSREARTAAAARTPTIAGTTPRPDPRPDSTSVAFTAAGGMVKFAINASDTLGLEVPGSSLTARVRHGMRQRWLDIQRRSSSDASTWLESLFLSHLGTAVSLLVPVFALFCSLLWRRARLFYAEHVVFAWHTHAQGLIAIAAARVAPGPLALLPTAWTIAYLWFAARRVYGADQESRARTTAKVALLSVVYFVTAGLGLIATLLVSLALGS